VFLTEHLRISHHYYAKAATEINKYEQPMVVGDCSVVSATDGATARTRTSIEKEELKKE
jgi:hypothetical protein